MSLEICRSKIQYKTRKKAWRASVWFFTQLGHYQTPYGCGYCKRFHLTGKYPQHPSKDFIEQFKKWYGFPVEL